ncbi:hypothetical protein HDV06_005127 [Boothiomyces sp. JEL0866]|nr:hypothetical protein HDV06_005127 [Boothiomyces sp. JEL0866]
MLGIFELYFVVLGQLYLLKVFAGLSKTVTPERVFYAQIGFSIFQFVAMGGMYLSVGYLGNPRPAFIKAHMVHKPNLESFHAIYVTRQIVKVQKLRNAVGLKAQTFKLLRQLVMTCIVIDWVAAIIWVGSFFLPGSLGDAVGMIGDAIGSAHILFITVIFKEIKTVNMRGTDVSIKLPGVPSSTTDKGESLSNNQNQEINLY